MGENENNKLLAFLKPYDSQLFNCEIIEYIGVNEDAVIEEDFKFEKGELYNLGDLGIYKKDKDDFLTPIEKTEYSYETIKVYMLNDTTVNIYDFIHSYPVKSELPLGTIGIQEGVVGCVQTKNHIFIKEKLIPLNVKSSPIFRPLKSNALKFEDMVYPLPSNIKEEFTSTIHSVKAFLKAYYEELYSSIILPIKDEYYIFSIVKGDPCQVIINRKNLPNSKDTQEFCSLYNIEPDYLKVKNPREGLKKILELTEEEK
jgi:hypothetical protein